MQQRLVWPRPLAFEAIGKRGGPAPGGTTPITQLRVRSSPGRSARNSPTLHNRRPCSAVLRAMGCSQATHRPSASTGEPSTVPAAFAAGGQVGEHHAADVHFLRGAESVSCGADVVGLVAEDRPPLDGQGAIVGGQRQAGHPAGEPLGQPHGVGPGGQPLDDRLADQSQVGGPQRAAVAEGDAEGLAVGRHDLDAQATVGELRQPQAVAGQAPYAGQGRVLQDEPVMVPACRRLARRLAGNSTAPAGRAKATGSNKRGEPPARLARCRARRRNNGDVRPHWLFSETLDKGDAAGGRRESQRGRECDHARPPLA